MPFQLDEKLVFWDHQTNKYVGFQSDCGIAPGVVPYKVQLGEKVFELVSRSTDLLLYSFYNKDGVVEFITLFND